MTKTNKKLIEVALPLQAINIASAREKSIQHGHPSTLHLWWARRPLAAARAVIFAQMVDDPSAYVETLLGDPATRRAAEREVKKRLELWRKRKVAFEAATGREAVAVPEPGPEPGLEDCAADIEGERLFKIIEDLVQWENTTNEAVLERARAEIWTSWRRACAENADHPRAKELFDRHRLPAFHDPFAGGGALPLEAQRLGLEAYASDLNPVAVLICKAMIEIPPKFAGRPPVNPLARAETSLDARQWKGAQGLAEDVRYYGKWMRDEAEKRIGHLYPKIEITADMAAARPDLKPLVGRKLTVIAWLWARTVKSPNPAFANVDVPLASTFMLSTKPGKEAYVEPVIGNGGYRFTVRLGEPKDAVAAKNGTKLSRGANFRCVMSGTPIAPDHIYGEANAGRMGARLMAIVAEGSRGRVYLSPMAEHEAIARQATPEWKPDAVMPENPRWFSPPLYGLKTYGDLFTPRQLVALTTFSDLVGEARERVKRDALEASLGARASRPRSEWHVRRLPHWEAGEVAQSITFRLADSLPRDAFDRLADDLSALAEDARAARHRQRIEALLDAGHGTSDLADPAVAAMVEDALKHFDGVRYRLHGWCVMPNHVHALITPLHGESLSAILRSWKSFTAKQANRILGREGAFWQEEYFDRVIRDERHFAAALAYIEDNAVKAGLCARAKDWLHSSAGKEDWRARRPPSQDEVSLADGGTGAQAYADAVATYLGFLVNKLADKGSTLCTWDAGPISNRKSSGRSARVATVRVTFGRQALPMTWDFAEVNFFSESVGSTETVLKTLSVPLTYLSASAITGQAQQADAQNQSIGAGKLISTDPPYYDNIGYADLSDFFYVWLRRSLKPIFPDLFSTLAVPKAEELVATPYRHGSKEKAEAFFLDGMTAAMHRLTEQAHPAFPVTIYYAYKQAETKSDEGTSSTGWQTFLDAVIRAGFAISGTWPVRTELGNRMIGSGTNSLASSIILVCRPRDVNAPTATRREFLNALKAELPAALAHLQRGNIAPVDLAQAAIGPGARDTVARAFYDVYRTQHQEFPPECRDLDYENRIKAAYPIHPEVFDRLYTDWSTLVRFQRTRGVLRLMAAVIHSLWEKGDRNPLILPANLPIDDPRVRDELTRYLPDTWKPVIEKDVDGPSALPLRIDGDVPNLGKFAACRRVARTVYLGSAPTATAANRGVEDRRVKLGCVMPGESPAVFGDALRRLSAAATYLYQDGPRYWYSTQPTVTKLAEDRAEQLKRNPDAVVQEIDKRLRADLRSTGEFRRIHPLPQSGADVPDDMDARLVVLGVDHPYSKEPANKAQAAATAIMESRGNAPRLFRNTLTFLAVESRRKPRKNRPMGW